MFEDSYNKKGYCVRCGKYKSLNIFKKCKNCNIGDKLMKKSKVVVFNEKRI